MKFNNKLFLTNNGGITLYYGRYILAALAILWLTLLAIIFLQQDITCPSVILKQKLTEIEGEQKLPKKLEENECLHFINELERIKNQLRELQEENVQLKKVASIRDFRPVKPDQFLIHKPPSENLASDYGGEDLGLNKIAPLIIAAEQNIKGQLYTKEHEEIRRILQNNIYELFLRINSQEFGKLIGKNNKNILMQQFEHILTQSRMLSLVDNAPEWHKRVLDKIAKRIKESLEKLQNPSDCKNAKLLICELNKGCGFGCQLHHITYCLIIAATSNRTLVLEKDGSPWRYSENGWNAAFLPIGKCSWAEHVILKTVQIENFNGITQPAKIVRLPIVDGLIFKPEQLPLAFPSQFADLLLIHHSNPPAFFIAQFLNFLMRENNELDEFVKKAKQQIPFHLGPIVGIQIRRTDKVGSEAAFHNLEEYMEWADLWFRIEKRRLNFPLLPKRIFIATDDPLVIKEAKEKYGNDGWLIFGNDETAEAKPDTRYTDRSLFGVIADVRLLAECSYIVCTFSSQVCRIGYELMQARVGDAGNNFHSLDDIFYFGGQSAHEVEAIDNFKSENNEQIDLNKGDIIGIAGNHWNGWSKGINRRTGRTGLFPSYLVREKWRIVDFPIFE